MRRGGDSATGRVVRDYIAGMTDNYALAEYDGFPGDSADWPIFEIFDILQALRENPAKSASWAEIGDSRRRGC